MGKLSHFVAAAGVLALAFFSTSTNAFLLQTSRSTTIKTMAKTKTSTSNRRMSTVMAAAGGVSSVPKARVGILGASGYTGAELVSEVCDCRV
jgi:hypothetical protein